MMFKKSFRNTKKGSHSKPCYFCRINPATWWRMATATLSKRIHHPTQPQKWICGICHPPAIKDVEWLREKEEEKRNDNTILHN
jgi:hypothetical protein